MSRLVQLDRDDDIAAVRGRLETATDPVVVLVAPVGAKVLRNPVHVRLIRRHAQLLGKELALVTRDGEARTNAREAGIRVFWTVRGVTVKDDRLTPPGWFSQVVPGLRGLAPWVTTTAALAALAAGALIFLPSAEITIYPKTETIDEALAMTASTSVTFPSVAQLKTPARMLETTLEVSGSAEGSGTRRDPEKAATGRVILTNNGDAPLEAPQGSRLVSENGVAFRTTRPVTVPPKPGNAEVEITAMEPGVTGNVGANTIHRFEDGDLNRRVGVYNPGPTQGGATRDGLAVTPEDRTALRQKLLEQLRTEGARRLSEQRQGEEGIYPETITVRALREIAEEAPPVVAGQKPVLNMKLEGVARGLAFDGKVVNETIARHLSERTDGRYTLLPGSLKTRPLEAFQWNDEDVSFHISVQSSVIPRVDKAALVGAVTGRTATEAEATLERLVPSSAAPQIRFWPFWVTRTPVFPWRVDLRFAGGEAAAANR